MSYGFTSILGIGSVLLLLALMSGIWAGLWGLWRARRGVGWWLMAVGTGFGTLGPMLYAAGGYVMFQRLSAASAAGTGPTTGPGFATPFVMGIGGMMIPLALLLFTIGFALHGLAAAKVAARAAELENLTAAMTEEINRLRAGDAS
jgi:hypothetical protein